MYILNSVGEQKKGGPYARFSCVIGMGNGNHCLTGDRRSYLLGNQAGTKGASNEVPRDGEDNLRRSRTRFARRQHEAKDHGARV